MGFRENWKKSNAAAKVLFVLIFIYAVSAVYFILYVIGIVPNIFGSAGDELADDRLWVYFSIASFSFATIIATYHLGTLMFKSKKSEDKQFDSTKKTS